jgi:hypothetical protein
MDLPTILNVITTAAVVFGVVFAVVEVRTALRSRRDQGAMEVIRAVESAEIRLAVARILELAIDSDPEVVNADKEVLNAAQLVFWAAEMYGAIVFEGVVDLHMLDRIDGGWLRATWLRLRRWVIAERSSNPNSAEWWEWLYDMLEANPDPGKASGAHVYYRGRIRR